MKTLEEKNQLEFTPTNDGEGRLGCQLREIWHRFRIFHARRRSLKYISSTRRVFNRSNDRSLQLNVTPSVVCNYCNTRYWFSDVNECLLDVCKPNEFCMNTRGSFICFAQACDTGFKNINGTCRGRLSLISILCIRYFLISVGVNFRFFMDFRGVLR